MKSKDYFAYSLIIVYVLTSTLSIAVSSTASEFPEAPTITDFNAPATVYANKYFLLNATIIDLDGIADFVNATVELSISVVLKWTSSPDNFSVYTDINNYCTVDSVHSFQTILNSTACKLSWRIKLGWICPEGNVDIIPTNTVVFDSEGNVGSGSAVELFFFQPNLVVSVKSSNNVKVRTGEQTIFNGTVYYEGTTIAPGAGACAAKFDGNSSYIQVAASPSLQLGQFSIEAWIKLDEYSPFVCPIVDKAAKDGGFSFWVGGKGFATGKLILNGGFGVQAFSIANVELGDWIYVAAVWNGSSVIFHENETSEVSSGYVSKDIGSLPVTIGKEQWAFNGFFNGTIDEVRIYNRTLTGVECNEHYQGIYENETGLILHLNLDGDCRDSSEMKNDGTSNGVLWTDGLANVQVGVTLEKTLKKMIDVVNSLDGSYFVSFAAETTSGQYTYTFYAVTAHGCSVQNGTTIMVVEKPPWYEPLSKWLLSYPTSVWVFLSIMIILVVLLSLNILNYDMKETTSFSYKMQKISSYLIRNRGETYSPYETLAILTLKRKQASELSGQCRISEKK